MGHPPVAETRYGPCDVLVVGGGMAGIAAAIAAARTGAATMLVERNGWLGGMGITGATGLHSFFNVFDASPGAVRMRVAAGIGQELVDRVTQMGGGMGHVRMERGGDFVSMLTPVEPEVFRLAAAQICLEAGARLLLHTIMDEVYASAGHIEGVAVWNKAGRSMIRAKQYVDCTGDSDLAAYAGAECIVFRPGDPGAYSAGFTFRLCNVDLGLMEEFLEERGLITQLAHAVKPGMTEPELVRLGINMKAFGELIGKRAPSYFLSSSLRPRELTYCNCINHGPNDGLDADALTDAESDLRAQMLGVAEMFRRHVRGCEQCYPAGSAPSVGQRRARAVRCQYELTKQDCTSAAQFADQIGCFGFIDNATECVRAAGAYGIPYRALIPRGLTNTLIAGRMMSVDTVAHNSTRNTVCCLICGQAAGAAAGMAAAQGVAPGDVDAEGLRETLAEAGALLEPRADACP